MNRQEHHKLGAVGADAPVRATVGRTPAGEAISIGVVAAMLGVRAAEPVVAVVPGNGEDLLPSGPFRPSEHRSLEGGTRAWIDQQTGVRIHRLQQLHAESDGSSAAEAVVAPHAVSISYLALVGPGQCSDRTRATWRSWYDYFPWEDWRLGKPASLALIEQRLQAWACQPAAYYPVNLKDDRAHRLRIAFGADSGWDEEKVLERCELLLEAGLIGQAAPAGPSSSKPARPMRAQHALTLARAISELRRAVKYRPVVFDLMQDEFTLFELQRAVEAILGPHLHKQNFRRLVENCGLVEPAGDIRLRTGGRPARLYRFRRDVVFERAAPGVRLKSGRA